MKYLCHDLDQTRTEWTDADTPFIFYPETEASRIAFFYNAVREKFNDETDRHQRALDEVGRIARIDGLTGLANRRMFFEMLQVAVDRARRLSLKGDRLAVYTMHSDGPEAAAHRHDYTDLAARHRNALDQ